MQTTGTLLWQIVNQSLNVAINSANANKSTPLSVSQMIQSYLLAVSASCSVALGLNAVVPRLKRVSPATKTVLARLVPFAAVATAGALNVFLMRGEEMRQGIDVYPVLSEHEKAQKEKHDIEVASLGKSKKAATIAVAETALSRVLNSTPIMVLPPLVLVRLQQTQWLKRHPRLTIPVNLGQLPTEQTFPSLPRSGPRGGTLQQKTLIPMSTGLILTTSVFALPLALAAFPQRQTVKATRLEERFWDRAGPDDLVEFNRGI